jgi:oxygen-independent coproporphyrinogen-3 oxidase
MWYNAVMTKESKSLAIYVHIPFCAKHCAYCDFNTYVEKAQSDIVQATVDALCADIEQTAQQEEQPATVATIFFGGGTPTFLSGVQLTRILQTVRENFEVLPDAEVSSEANPGSSDAEKFAQMRAAGFNRLSIGVQSFHDELLVALDRFHTAHEAENAFAAARAAGFDNINLDLMFRLPRQTPELWLASLRRAVALETEHLSLYALTLEPGTRFERQHTGGKLHLPDEETEAAMYAEAITTLTAAGYEHYEVSNFAQPGYRCRHNLTYWRNDAYLGFGPGAVSYRHGRRWKRERLPARYVAKVRARADLTVETETLEPDAAFGETLMLGLRLRDGVSRERLRARFGIDVCARNAAEIALLTERGLLAVEGDTLRLTERGLFLADEVATRFL